LCIFLPNLLTSNAWNITIAKATFFGVCQIVEYEGHINKQLIFKFLRGKVNVRSAFCDFFVSFNCSAPLVDKGFPNALVVGHPVP